MRYYLEPVENVFDAEESEKDRRDPKVGDLPINMICGAYLSLTCAV
jgi:hypothetical protein